MTLSHLIEASIAERRRVLQRELRSLLSLNIESRPPQLLRLCRQYLDITQEHLSLEIGVSRSAILQIERCVYANDKVYDLAMQYLASKVEIEETHES